MAYPAAAVALFVEMSREQRTELRRRAAEHGMTMRAYALWKLFDVEEIDLGRPGRKVQRQEELPMTG